MTLVVARMHGERIALVSDTCISKLGLQLPVHQGAIKTCIINCSICVAFSNSSELAARDIVAFVRRYDEFSGFAKTIEFFENSSRLTGNDYIVAFANPPKMVKICDGRRMKTASRTLWIGDAEAYQAFRRYETDRRHRAERGRAINAVMFADEMNGSPASDLYSSMRHVLSDRSISSVGGFASVISNRPEGFRYSVYSDMLFDWPSDQGDEYLLSLNDKWKFGASDENENYSVAQLSPGYIGANCVAFYFVRSLSLFLFLGRQNGPSVECRSIRGVRPQAVVQTLNEICGFDWKWLALVTSAPKSAGTPVPADEEGGVRMSFVCHLNTMPAQQSSRE
jgi:hypothetical protein